MRLFSTREDNVGFAPANMPAADLVGVFKEAPCMGCHKAVRTKLHGTW